ncbi:MAG: M61 family metallopeptidase [Saezia sp.]
MLEYDLRIKDSKAHTWVVSLKINKPLAKMRVSLPVWIPGSYLVREFSKHLSFLRAVQGGKHLKITQLDKCTWEIGSQESEQALELSWEVYAFDASVRAAYLDQYRGFVNGTSVFLRPHGLEHKEIQLSLYLEDGALQGWDYACALPSVKEESKDKNALAVLKASSYDELVDSPIELGRFWRGQFKVADVVHEFVVSGASATFDGERLLKDAQRICEKVVGFWGHRQKLPYERYVFMLNAMDNSYGGLEHKASTALICKREDLPRVGESAQQKDVRVGYQNLLTLICHEFFHTWHVKRMRPAELEVYDYSQENYTELLWFFEGVTSYYEYMLAYRADLLTQEQLLQWMSKDLASVERMPGRQVQTLGQASFDAWVKFYRVDENTPNATVSYYTKGAMVALCLDLTLRQEGKGTLDDVMRLLWLSSHGGSITEKDVLHALHEVGGRSYARELQAWVHSTKELPVEKLLQKAGAKIKRTPVTRAQNLGVTVQKTPSGITLKTVLKGSVAEQAGMAAGDELIAANGWRLTDLEHWDTYVKQGELGRVLIARDGQVMQLDVQADAKTLGVPELQMLPAKERQDLVSLIKFWPQK